MTATLPNSFQGHRGRPGQRGGSVPRDGGGGGVLPRFTSSNTKADIEAKVAQYMDRVRHAFDNYGGQRQAGGIFQRPKSVLPTKEEAEGTTPGHRYNGQCFEMAGRYAVFEHGHQDSDLTRNLRVIHGTIQGDTGPLIAHGWVESGDKVFDGTRQEWYDKASYYQTHRAVPEKTYTVKEARKEMFRTKNFGPWHETAGVFNALKSKGKKS